MVTIILKYLTKDAPSIENHKDETLKEINNSQKEKMNGEEDKNGSLYSNGIPVEYCLNMKKTFQILSYIKG